MLFVPPRIRTFPLFSSVALAPARLIVIFPTELNVPLDGSYTSALAVSPPGVSPPATRTFPLFNRVAVAPWRAIVITPVETNCGKLPTNKVVIALADWYEAVIVVCPLVCVVTSPELSIVATVGAEDVQVTWCVRSCDVVPRGIPPKPDIEVTPTAVNWTPVVPGAAVGNPGDRDRRVLSSNGATAQDAFDRESVETN